MAFKYRVYAQEVHTLQQMFLRNIYCINGIACAFMERNGIVTKLENFLCKELIKLELRTYEQELLKSIAGQSNERKKTLHIYPRLVSNKLHFIEFVTILLESISVNARVASN